LSLSANVPPVSTGLHDVAQLVSYNRRMTTPGRKRPSGEGKPLTVRVDASLDRRLQATAAREGLSISDFVRQAIVERLDRGAVATSLWDRIAPSVVQRTSRGRTGRRASAARSDVTSGNGGPRTNTHTEFAAGLEAEAASAWRRGEA
jgi:hypothetical protein